MMGSWPGLLHDYVVVLVVWVQQPIPAVADMFLGMTPTLS